MRQAFPAIVPFKPFDTLSVEWMSRYANWQNFSDDSDRGSKIRMCSGDFANAFAIVSGNANGLEDNCYNRQSQRPSNLAYPFLNITES